MSGEAQAANHIYRFKIQAMAVFRFQDIIPTGIPDAHRFVLSVEHVCPIGQINKGLSCGKSVLTRF